MPRYKLVNGERIQLTAQEEADRNAEEAAWEAGAFDRAMVELRSKRNRDLKDSDWTQLPDTTLTNVQRQAWMQFRT